MWYVLLLIACIAGDQLLKYWVVRHLDVGQSAAFLPGLVRLTRLHNTGAAWGSFSGKTALLTAVTAVLLVAVAWLVLKKSSATPGPVRRHAGAGRRHRQHDRPDLAAATWWICSTWSS